MRVPPIRRWLVDLLGLTFPARCGACQGAMPPDEGAVCVDCQRSVLALVDQPHCTLCGQDVGPFGLRQGGRCGQCDESLYRYDALVRVGAYQPPLDALIRRFKYSGASHLAGPLAVWQAARLSAQPWAGRVDALVPIPLHWRRRLGRGFNQSEMLAEAVGDALNLPVANLLSRPVNRPPQASLPRSQRFENVRGVFAAGRVRRVRGRVLCLVDDVCTTGATLSEAARTLRTAGAAEVFAAVVGVAQPPTAYSQAMDDPN